MAFMVPPGRFRLGGALLHHETHESHERRLGLSSRRTARAPVSCFSWLSWFGLDGSVWVARVFTMNRMKAMNAGWDSLRHALPERLFHVAHGFHGSVWTVPSGWRVSSPSNA
jgi:hypothetical protein